MVTCPVCERTRITESRCPQCGSDLQPLLRLGELPYLYYNEGIRLINENKIDEAIETLSTAVAFNSGFAKPHIALATAYNREGLYKEAIAQLEKALATEPKNDKLLEARQNIETQMKRQLAGQAEQKRKLTRFRKLLIGAPIAAFLGGLFLVLVIQHLSSQSPPVATIETEAEELKNSITNEPALAGSNIHITHANGLLTISGSIESEIHKQLILERAKNIVRNYPLATENLSVVPKPVAVTYKVLRGESLSRISERFYDTPEKWTKVFQANIERISDPNIIKANQKLQIPIDDN
ncbi:MAG: LysM peptidoglycan-binding domain-containing protein [bacterium]